MAISGNVDPGAVARTGIELLDDKVVASALVTRESFEQFRGKPGYTFETTVPGVLPYREYEWNNDRSEPIKTDDYTETVVSAKIEPNRIYSAIDWTDEQEFEFGGAFGRAVDAQMDAVARGLEDRALAAIATAPYERVIRVDNTPTAIQAAADLGRDVFFNAIVDAKSALSKLRAPRTNLVALASDEFADELEKNHKLTLNQGRGDTALAQSSIGAFAGVQFVRSNVVPAGQAILFDKTAFVLFTGAPRIPRSVPFGASVSHKGFGLSWLMDYSSGYLEDRSVFQAWVGSNHTLEHARQYAPHIDSDDRYFVRGVKLGLADSVTERKPGDGSGSTPGSAADSVLAKVWNNTVPGITAGEGTYWPDHLRHPASAADPVDPTP